MVRAEGAASAYRTLHASVKRSVVTDDGERLRRDLRGIELSGDTKWKRRECFERAASIFERRLQKDVDVFRGTDQPMQRQGKAADDDIADACRVEQSAYGDEAIGVHRRHATRPPPARRHSSY